MRRWTTVMAAGMALSLAITACGSSGGTGSSGSGGATGGSGAAGPKVENLRTLAAGSASKVIDAGSFRFEQVDRGQMTEYYEMCNKGSSTVTGAIDTEQRIAAFDLRGGTDIDVVITSDTYFVRSTALKGWDVPTAWLAVPLDDAQAMKTMAIVTGLRLRPTFWDQADASNPLTALKALGPSITSVKDKGTAVVRGTRTTHLRVAVDPEKAGLWTGGTTTTSTTTTTSAAGDRKPSAKVIQFRKSLIDSGEFGKIPADVGEAYLGGDPKPLIAFLERTAPKKLTPGSRATIDALASGDTEAILDAFALAASEEGDPWSDQDRKMMEGLLALDDGAKTPGIGDIFAMFSKVDVDAYVADDGLLRRLDLVVTMGTGDDAKGADSAEPLADTTIEFWAIGEPTGAKAPAAEAATRFDQLGKGDIPNELSNCVRGG